MSNAPLAEVINFTLEVRCPECSETSIMSVNKFHFDETYISAYCPRRKCNTPFKIAGINYAFGSTNRFARR